MFDEDAYIVDDFVCGVCGGLVKVDPSNCIETCPQCGEEYRARSAVRSI